MPLILRRVGRYDVIREIGRGGMATVYLGRQTDLDRSVALKELAAPFVADPAFAERFVRESRVAGSLSHTNIVTVYDFFEHTGTPYISMEYLERGSLRPFVGTLTLAQIAAVLEGLLAGLAHAEHHGIVHRDIKPENVMLTLEGSLKIADFGIAKAYNQAVTSGRFQTATGTAVGTPTYMAPEQAMAKEVGPWTDLYSTGILAYELVVGRVPFESSDTPMAILMKHVNEPPPPPRSVDPHIDPQLSEWIEWLLDKQPSARPAGAYEAWEALEEIILRLLGPRWRREARLLERSPDVEPPKPLTPAPFYEEEGAAGDEPGPPESVETPTPVDDGFMTRRGTPDRPTASPAVPAPPVDFTPPEAPAEPLAEKPPDVEADPRLESEFISYQGVRPTPLAEPTPPPLEAVPPPATTLPPTEAVPEPTEPTPPPLEAVPPPAETPPPIEAVPVPTEPTPPPLAAAPPPPAATVPPTEAAPPPAETPPPIEAVPEPTEPTPPPVAAVPPPPIEPTPPASAAAPPPVSAPSPTPAPLPIESPPEPALPAAAASEARPDDRSGSFIWPALEGRARIGQPMWSRRRIGAALAILGAGVAAVVLVLVLVLGGGESNIVKTNPPPRTEPKPSPAGERSAFGASGSSLYLAAPTGHVTRLDPATLEAETTIADPARPRGIAVAGDKVYVADDDTLTVLGSPSLRPTSAVPFAHLSMLAGGAGAPVVAIRNTTPGHARLCVVTRPARPRCATLAYAPTGLGVAPSGRIFVADGTAGTIASYDAKARPVGAAIAVGKDPHGNAVEFSKRLYVPVDRGVAVVDIATRKVIRTIPLPGTPASIWIAPSTGRLFAPLYAQNKVAVVDTATPDKPPKLVATGPRPVAVSGSGSSVYVANADKSISRLDARTGEAAPLREAARSHGFPGPCRCACARRERERAESDRHDPVARRNARSDGPRGSQRVDLGRAPPRSSSGRERSAAGPEGRGRTAA